LIFDEVITGFRVGLGGAQALLGVTPDLAVFAKAMAAGFPISCLAGNSCLMELIGSGRVMHGGTYNSNVVSIAAALATIDELQRDDGAAYPRLYALGEKLMDGLRSAARMCGAPLLVQGLGPVFHAAFTRASEITDYWSYRATDTNRLTRFVEALLENGINVTSRGTWFLSTVHTDDDIDQTLAAAARALQESVEAAGSWEPGATV
jgi:glutamate-1-semialdehyde 2,1-aminomutase